MITQQSIQGALADAANNNIFDVVGIVAPTNGTSGTGVGICGLGSTYTNTVTGIVYINIGTILSPVWAPQVSTVTGQITSANLTGTSAGQFGHASGFIMVPAPGAGLAVILLNAVLSYVFGTAAYTAGGNTTINWGSGGAAITGLISNANFAAAAVSKPVQFGPLATVGFAIVPNVSLNAVTSAAFTQPGTAVGVINYAVTYMLVTL